MQNFEAFFSPRSVAVVGVSEDPEKLGTVVFDNMRDAGFSGPIYPVNPKYTTLFGFTCFKRVCDIPEEVDLTCIIVPAPFVKDILTDCAQKGVKAVIIISAGFKETGEDGKRLEEEIVELARQNNIRIIGPNCLGIIATRNKVNASFAAGMPAAGDIAFVSQSGAFCTAMLDMAIPANIGFSHFISFGNKCDIDEIDLIDMWMKDPEVKVIGAYLEEIKYGREFIQTIRNADAPKPVVIFKPGQTNEAKKAISSHTGALAGSIQTFKTAISQNGIIEVKTVRSLFNVLMGFSWSTLPQGNNVAIVTNAGGPGIIATDAVIQAGFKMAELSTQTTMRLQEKLPSSANIHNPIDVVGDALADRYEASITALAEDPNIDAILVILTPQRVTQIENTAKAIIYATKKTNKPIIPVFIGQKYTQPGQARFYDNKIASFRDISDAIETLKALYEYNMFIKNRSALKTDMNSYHGTYRETVKAYLNSTENTPLPEELAQKMAQEVGLALPMQQEVQNLEQAISFCSNLYPVAIKAPNRLIPHKTDFKAVYLNIKNETELTTAYNELVQTIATKTGITNPPVLVQEFIDYKELIFIGANRDGLSDVYTEHKPGFGHLVAFGQGGIYTEIYKDIEYLLTPYTEDDVNKVFAQTRVSKIIEGARGQKPLPKDAIVNSIMSIQDLLYRYPEIVSIDINPLLVTYDKVAAVDIKIFVAP